MEQTCCCGGSKTCASIPNDHMPMKENWVVRELETPAGPIPIIASALSRQDIVNGWKVRWGFRRMNYQIRPGLYGIGNPDAQAPVLVTANYKLSFDALRKELKDIDAWILALDTRGVNVWCAAGKGTFGTAELLGRLKAVRLDEIVSHKTLILPQLGATGVAAHEVLKASGFTVIYGPVRASDLPDFLAHGRRKSEAMRTVTFALKDRLAVVPVEIVSKVKPMAIIFGVLLVLHIVTRQRLDPGQVAWQFLPYFGSIVLGTIGFPILLPYLPTRSFAVKGALLGLAWGLLWSRLAHLSFGGTLATVLLQSALIAFISLNFTGSTTFTSLSGAQFEVKIAVPIIGVCAVMGLILGIVS